MGSLRIPLLDKITGKLPSSVLPDLSGNYVPVTAVEINVKNYGAVGDGTADDTTAVGNALTAWLASLSAGKPAKLVFPIGTYKVTHGFTLTPTAATVGGAIIGHGAKLRQVGGTDPYLLTLTTQGAGLGWQRPVIEGLQFDKGGIWLRAGTNGEFIWNATLDKVHVTNAPQCALRLSGIFESQVTSSHFEIDPTVTPVDDAICAVLIEKETGKAQPSSLAFRDVTTRGGWRGIRSPNAADVRIYNATILAAKREGIFLQGNGCVIDGIHAEDNAIDGTTGVAAVRLEGSGSVRAIRAIANTAASQAPYSGSTAQQYGVRIYVYDTDISGAVVPGVVLVEDVTVQSNVSNAAALRVTGGQSGSTVYIGEGVPSKSLSGISGIRLVHADRALYDVRTYGALCDGTTDDSAAVAAAALAASATGGRVLFPQGTTRAANIPIYTNVHFEGAGYGATTVKAPSGVTTPVFITDQFATLTGTNTTGGPYAWSISNMTIDGNKTGNPSGGNGLSIYGSNYTLRSLRIINCRGKGVYSEWTSNTVTSGGGLEARWDDVNIADAEQMAVQFLGPHDSIWHGVVGSNCARTSGDAIFDLTGVKASRCHGWGSYHARTWILRASCQLAGSDCEGGTTSQIQILANDQLIEHCNIYNGWSGANASYGVEIGDGTHAPAGYKLLGKIEECGNGTGGGAINFVNDGGQGAIDLLIYQSAGTMMIGTPASTTAYNLRCNGSATKPDSSTVHGVVFPAQQNVQFAGNTYLDGATRLRASSSGQLTAFAGATPFWATDSINKFIHYENSAKIRFWSDSLTTRTMEIDAATGFITFGGTSGPRLVFGTSTPEGAVTGPVGSLFIRSDGGSATSLYVKESGTGNTGWVPVGSLARAIGLALGAAMIVGNYYATPGVVISTGIVGNGSERTTPIVVGRDCTIDSLAISCTVAGSAGSLVRLGIRADNGGIPGTLLADAGTVDTSTAGVKTATLGTPLAVALGTKLHLTATPQGSPATGPTLRTHAQQTAAYGGVGDSSATNVLDTVLTSYQATGTTGALPSTQSWSGAGAAIRVAAHVSA